MAGARASRYSLVRLTVASRPSSREFVFVRQLVQGNEHPLLLDYPDVMVSGPRPGGPPPGDRPGSGVFVHG